MSKDRRGGQNAGRFNKNKPFTSDEKDAIEAYVSGEMMYVNQALRGRGMTVNDLDSGEKAFIKDLDSATSRTVGETTLYRSVDSSAIFGDMSDTQYENLVGHLVYGDNQRLIVNSANKTMDGIVGKKITEKGFMSTTADYEVARDWGSFTGSDKPIVVEIKTTKKTKGADVSYTDKNVSKDEAQKERLLARNQSYTVTSIGAKDGNIYVKVKME